MNNRWAIIEQSSPKIFYQVQTEDGPESRMARLHRAIIAVIFPTINGSEEKIVFRKTSRSPNFWDGRDRKMYSEDETFAELKRMLGVGEATKAMEALNFAASKIKVA